MRLLLGAFMIYMLFAQSYLTDAAFRFIGTSILSLAAVFGFRAIAGSKVIQNLKR